MRKSVFAGQKWHDEMIDRHRAQAEADRQRELSRARGVVQTSEGAADGSEEALGDNNTARDRQGGIEQARLQADEEDPDASPHDTATFRGDNSKQAECNSPFPQNGDEYLGKVISTINSEEVSEMAYVKVLSLIDQMAAETEGEVLVQHPTVDHTTNSQRTLPESHVVSKAELKRFAAVVDQRLLAVIGGAKLSNKERQALKVEIALLLSMRATEGDDVDEDEEEDEEGRGGGQEQEEEQTRLKTNTTHTSSPSPPTQQFPPHTSPTRHHLPIGPSTYSRLMQKTPSLQHALQAQHTCNTSPSTHRCSHQTKLILSLHARVKQLAIETQALLTEIQALAATPQAPREIQSQNKPLNTLTTPALHSSEPCQRTIDPVRQVEQLQVENQPLRAQNKVLQERGRGWEEMQQWDDELEGCHVLEQQQQQDQQPPPLDERHILHFLNTLPQPQAELIRDILAQISFPGSVSHEPETGSEVAQVQGQVQPQPHPYIRGPDTATSPSRTCHSGAGVFGRFWCSLPGGAGGEGEQQCGRKRKYNSEANSEEEYDGDSDSTFVSEDFTTGDGVVEWGGDVEMNDGDGFDGGDDDGDGFDGSDDDIGDVDSSIPRRGMHAKQDSRDEDAGI